MRLRSTLLVVFLCALAALQGAVAAETSTAQFLVSVRGTVTKQWSYTTSRLSEGCRVQVTGTGTRKISLRSRDVAVVTARWAGGRSLVRFSGRAGPLAGSVTQAGTKTTRATGPAECEQSESHATCASLTRTLRNERAELVSGRAHKLSFRGIKRLVPAAFFNRCPGEPSAVRSVSGALDLADAKFSERDLFDRSVGGLTLQGSTDVTTTLLNRSATIVQHVRWTLTLRRLGG